MPEINFIAIIIAALVPNVLGAISFQALFGKQWLNSLNFTEEDMKGRNDALIYGSALLLSFVVAFFLNIIIELTHKDVSAEGELIFASFQTFGHGAIHGVGLAVGLVLPVVICLGLFQKAKGSNILLNSIFWLLCFAIMGGIVDNWS